MKYILCHTRIHQAGRAPLPSLPAAAMSLALLLSLTGTAWEAAAREVRFHDPIPFVTTGAEIDGVITGDEWREALRMQLVNETHPSQNVPALVATEVMVMEDGANLYLAFVAEDPEPDKIRAYYRDRDSAFDDDFVGVVLDTFNDERRAFEFFSNPLGVQMDLINDDVVRREDASWNAIWDSAGQITATGYTVEMKIPLKQLRFTGGLDKQTWGIDLLRFYPRDKRHRLSNNTMDYSVSCYLCQFNKIQGFSNLEENRNLQLVPTVTGSYARNRSFPFTTGWEEEFTAEAGMDVRWGINQDIYLNATFNPDFSQVEADVAQLDINNTFSLFFPERRDFFLDGADYFNTEANLVHTRNISAPDYGAKITGKLEAHTLGVFFANDETTNFLMPGNQGSGVASLKDVESHNLALRYRYDINRNASVGLIGTGRLADGYHNLLGGIDGNLRIGDSDRITAQVLTTRTEYPRKIQNDYRQPAGLRDNAYLLAYSHQDQRWDWDLRYTDYGDDFRADLGFINRVDYRQALIGGGHNWRFGPGSRFSRIRIGGDWDITWDQAGRELEHEIEMGVNAEGPFQSFMFLGYGQRRRFYEDRYFQEYFVNFFGQMKPLSGMSIGLGANGGDTIDFANARLGQQITVSPQVNLFLGKHFLMNLRHNFQIMQIDGENLYTTNLSDLRLTYQFNIRSFLRATILYSDTVRDPELYRFTVDRRSRNLTLQLLYSYKINPQTLIFVGYSDTRDNEHAVALEQRDRRLFVKIGYAWVL